MFGFISFESRDKGRMRGITNSIIAVNAMVKIKILLAALDNGAKMTMQTSRVRISRISI